MSLVLVGIHRNYTVKVVSRGTACPIQHHRAGGRTVVREESTASKRVFRDVL